MYKKTAGDVNWHICWMKFCSSKNKRQIYFSTHITSANDHNHFNHIYYFNILSNIFMPYLAINTLKKKFKCSKFLKKRASLKRAIIKSSPRVCMIDWTMNTELCLTWHPLLTMVQVKWRRIWKSHYQQLCQQVVYFTNCFYISLDIRNALLIVKGSRVFHFQNEYKWIKKSSFICKALYELSHLHKGNVKL